MIRRPFLRFALLCCLIAAVASLLEVRASRARHEEAFQTDARIMHRLLSQRAVQHEAILATLALSQANSTGANDVQRLPAVYPQILRVVRRPAAASWGGDLPVTLAAAEAESQGLRRAVFAAVDPGAARYWLVLAAHPASFALEIDAHSMVPWEEWPLPKQGSPVRVALQAAGQEILLAPGAAAGEPGGLGQRLSFNKTIAADSQPFNVAVSRQLDWRSLPWGRLALWWLGSTALEPLTK